MFIMCSELFNVCLDIHWKLARNRYVKFTAIDTILFLCFGKPIVLSDVILIRLDRFINP